MRRNLVLVLVLVLAGCARGIVDEQEGSITSDVPPATAEEPARRVSANVPPATGTARASFEDPAGDASEGADVTRVTVAQDKEFMLEVAVETSGSGNVDVYIDSDFDQRTGVGGGFDVRVSGSAASDALELWFLEGGTWTAQSAPTFSGSYAKGKLVMRIHRAYLGFEGSRGPIAINVGTQGDRAPDGAPMERWVFKPL